MVVMESVGGSRLCLRVQQVYTPVAWAYGGRTAAAAMQ